MRIEIKIDANCDEPKILVITDKITDEVDEIIKRISEQTSNFLAGFQEDNIFILEPDEILRVYSANQKVYAVTESEKYTIRLRLYEAEERFSSLGFVRISNSEIINLKKVKGLDLSMSGTICVKFQNGTISYVSRRYVSKIKQILGV